MQESISGGFSGGAAAPKGRRFASGLIDLFIIPILLGIVIGVVLLNVPEGIRNVLLILVNIGWLIFRDMVYSPGRHMVGLKLVSLNGQKVTITQAFLRNVLIVVPFVLVIGYLVEIIAILSKGERIADGWAKTRVVSAT
ncbi:MAG: RDD family protein [Candidatus Omnitrophica bacterium]|nr:RDD family protein [Candidatus Omnitrophota bacterium]